MWVNKNSIFIFITKDTNNIKNNMIDFHKKMIARPLTSRLTFTQMFTRDPGLSDLESVPKDYKYLELRMHPLTLRLG